MLDKIKALSMETKIGFVIIVFMTIFGVIAMTSAAKYYGQ